MLKLYKTHGCWVDTVRLLHVFFFTGTGSGQGSPPNYFSFIKGIYTYSKALGPNKRREETS